MSDEMNAITGDIVDAAIEVHRTLGPGLLERVYHLALLDVLRRRGRDVRSQVPVDIRIHDRTIDAGFRIDMIVDGTVVVELKSVERLHSLHEAQVLTYLRLARREVGLLLNFNVTRMSNGIRRFVRQV